MGINRHIQHTNQRRVGSKQGTQGSGPHYCGLETQQHSPQESIQTTRQACGGRQVRRSSSRQAGRRGISQAHGGGGRSHRGREGRGRAGQGKGKDGEGKLQGGRMGRGQVQGTNIHEGNRAGSTIVQEGEEEGEGGGLGIMSRTGIQPGLQSPTGSPPQSVSINRCVG